MRQVCQQARIISTYSRRRGLGGPHGTEKRRSLCPLICVPMPMMKRPPENSWRSQPWFAITYGERANATVTLLPMRTFSLCSATSASAVNGLCWASGTQSAS